MIERAEYEFEWRAACAEVAPECGDFFGASQPLQSRFRAHIAYDNNLTHAGKLLKHLCYGAERVECLAAIEITIGSNQHRRRDLAEAIQHAADAEVRRA